MIYADSTVSPSQRLHAEKTSGANKSAKNILWFIVCRYIYNVCGVGLGQDNVGAERTF